MQARNKSAYEDHLIINRKTSDITRKAPCSAQTHLNPSNAKATFVQSTMQIFENHLNPVTLVFIGKLWLSTVRFVPMCQGFGQIFFFHLFEKLLATSSIRVNLAACTSLAEHWNWSSSEYLRYLVYWLDALQSVTLIILPDLHIFWEKNTSKPCHVGNHWIALTECSQMSTHVPGFQSFFRFLHHFVMAKLATSSLRLKFQLCASLVGYVQCSSTCKDRSLKRLSSRYRHVVFNYRWIMTVSFCWNLLAAPCSIQCVCFLMLHSKVSLTSDLSLIWWSCCI